MISLSRISFQEDDGSEDSTKVFCFPCCSHLGIVLINFYYHFLICTLIYSSHYYHRPQLREEFGSSPSSHAEKYKKCQRKIVERDRVVEARSFRESVPTQLNIGDGTIKIITMQHNKTIQILQGFALHPYNQSTKTGLKQTSKLKGLGLRDSLNLAYCFNFLIIFKVQTKRRTSLKR